MSVSASILSIRVINTVRHPPFLEYKKSTTPQAPSRFSPCKLDLLMRIHGRTKICDRGYSEGIYGHLFK
nr:MAG TPA: hypothetical protein [Caudoviricetes sp.]